jgi:glycosyltransferase involved in cell wall biosynthesis
MAHLWLTCARRRVSLLHCNADIVSGFYCMAAALAGVKRRIAHYRVTAPPGNGLYQLLLLHLGRMLLRLFATDVIGVCAAARTVAGVSDARWTTLYNGISRPTAAEGRAADGEPRRLLFLGRIHPEKGYKLAVDIFERVAARSAARAELHFVGGGEGGEIERLRARISASPAAGAIHVHGLSRTPYDHLAGASLLLLPSAREGLSGSVLEALSHGVPVVASDLPGPREIKEGTAGVRLVPRDSPLDRWADAIEAALADPSRDVIKEAFARSPFLFEAHKKAIEHLWSLGPAAER